MGFYREVMSYEQTMLAQSGSNHMAGYAAESRACAAPWLEKWIDRVERLLAPAQAVTAAGGRR